jgi:hypothetical protein
MSFYAGKAAQTGTAPFILTRDTTLHHKANNTFTY